MYMERVESPSLASKRASTSVSYIILISAGWLPRVGHSRRLSDFNYLGCTKIQATKNLVAKETGTTQENGRCHHGGYPHKYHFGAGRITRHDELPPTNPGY